MRTDSGKSLIHHGPTKGGADEGAKYELWYRRTLISYLEHFSEVPPADIWPKPEKRFKSGGFRRVDMSDDRLFKRKAPLFVVLPILMLVLAIGGLYGAVSEDWGLFTVALLVTGFYGASKLFFKGFGKLGGGGGGSGAAGCGGGCGGNSGDGGGCGSGCGGCGG